MARPINWVKKKMGRSNVVLRISPSLSWYRSRRSWQKGQPTATALAPEALAWARTSADMAKLTFSWNI
jgi:hypothetical protein